ncbi:MAG: thiamine phosphate synthase [Methanobacteriaceae archaeon]|jgi:thiamine-phosphate pyrophosphorylase|nr:thiamine phosphate synthase [Methanobacteriaceae archaeon]
MKDIDYSLYLVTDNKNEKEFLEIIEESIKGGVNLVQLREKTLDTKNFFNLALKVKKICSNYNIPLIINDRVDIAIAIDADGVHVGQDDMPCTVVRKMIGKNKIVGVSTSTVEESIKAEKDGADYIGSGAVFNTSTKDDAPSITKNELKKVVESVSIPTIAIGGITQENIKEFKGTKIKGISVVSAIMNSDNPKLSAEKLKDEFNKL